VQAAGDLARRALVLDVGAQDGELVAAEPGDDVAGPGRLAQPRGDLQQQAVAGLVAEAVVDQLEVVEVQEEDRERAPERGLLAQPRQEAGAVGPAAVAAISVRRSAGGRPRGSA
jgi:hypothetical protein